MTKEPLICDFEKARVGCKLIADHILDLSDASRRLLTVHSGRKRAKNALRSAYILNLIGYEEAGKLFMMWQALADAERKEENRIRIDEFEYHEPKGDLAGDLCCQMLDFVENVLTDITNSVDDSEEPVPKPPEETFAALILSVIKTSVSTHRERIYRIRRHFKQEREDAMYVDFRNGDWVTSPQLSPEMLSMDCLLLQIVARAANAYLAEGLKFSLATKALSDLSKDIKSDEADEFLSVLKKRDPEWFNVLKGRET